MRVQVIQETGTGNPLETGRWELYFQWCLYVYDDGQSQHGYRFIWRRPNGNLQAARGQARLPSIAQAKELMDKAIEEGWGANEA